MLLPSSTGQVLLAGAAACAVLLYRAWSILIQERARRQMKLAHGCQPVHPRVPQRFPLVSLEHIIAHTRAYLSGQLLRGSIDGFNQLGATYMARTQWRDTIVTADPQNVKTLLATKFKDYTVTGFRHRAFKPLMGNGIFNADGERWKRSRALIRPNFGREQVADLTVLEKHMQTMLGLIPRDGTTIDLQDLFYLFALDSATELLFGRAVGVLDDWSRGERSTATTLGESLSSAMLYILIHSRLRTFSRFFWWSKGARAIRFCHDYIDKTVDDALRKSSAEKSGDGSSGSSRYIFLEQLALLTSDPVELREEAMSVLVAGRDTTASLLGNLFFVLARRPDLWAKLQAEIAHLNGQPPTYQDLKNLTLLRYCLNESLRLYPVVPANTRTASVDTVLPRGGGPDGQSPVFVKKGTTVGYSVYVMHRREDLYGEDAAEFKPERWETLRPDWSYLPFNGGPRVCIGQQFALTEAGYVTVRLLQELSRLESRDPHEWQEHVTLTVRSKTGVKVGVYASDKD